MGTELPSMVILGQTLVLMQMTFKWHIKLLIFNNLMYNKNNVGNGGGSVLPRTTC
jgi:hypothetical protein